MSTPELEALRAFRHQVYTRLGCRRDALFELLDALLTAGTMALEQLERLMASYPLATKTAWYAVDASVWPRCDAETSLERGYYHHPYRHSHGQPIVAGWNYSWLVQLPSRCSRWTAPLRVRRLTPGENVNAVAAEQIRSWLGQASPARPGRLSRARPASRRARRGTRAAGAARLTDSLVRAP